MQSVYCCLYPIHEYHFYGTPVRFYLNLDIELFKKEKVVVWVVKIYKRSRDLLTERRNNFLFSSLYQKAYNP
jgi:hypothetical protein